jgi:hypothetical protein
MVFMTVMPVTTILVDIRKLLIYLLDKSAERIHRIIGGKVQLKRGKVQILRTASLKTLRVNLNC